MITRLLMMAFLPKIIMKLEIFMSQKLSRQCFCIAHKVTLWEKRLFGDRKICIVARRLFKDIWFIMIVSYG